MITKILAIVILYQFSLLTSTVQAQQYTVDTVLWSDTTIDVVDVGDQEATPKKIKAAYIPSLQAQILSFDSSLIGDFIKKIDTTVSSLSKWKTYRDMSCGIEFKYPSNYRIDTMRLIQDPCYGIALTKNRSQLKRNRSMDEIEEHSDLEIYFTNNSFPCELSANGLDVDNESDLFRGILEDPVYLKAKNYKAVYWQNQFRGYDNDGLSYAAREEAFFIMVEGQPGTAVWFDCGVDIVNLLIASTFKFIE